MHSQLISPEISEIRNRRIFLALCDLRILSILGLDLASTWPRPGLTASAPRWLTDVSPFAHAFAAMISSEFTGLETTVDATGALGQRFANPP